jgi:uncharacterized protein YggT (Ycf19 family)
MTDIITPTTKSAPLYRGTQITWYILTVLEFLLAARFILKFLGANTYAGFTQFIYGITYPFAQPFLNVFRVTRVAGTTIEWTTLLAMLFYYFLALGIIRFILINKPVSSAEAEVKLDRQDPTTPTDVI